jgi:hypothetical protein
LNLYLFFVLNLILFYRSLKPHLFCHSILPFIQLLLFSVFILFYRLLKPHLFLSKLYSTIRSTPTLFCLDPILPFAQTPSFFFKTLFVNRVSNELRVEKFFVFVHFHVQILIYHLSNTHLFLFHLFFGLIPIQLFVGASSLFCLNIILFYHSSFFVIILFYCLFNSHFFLSPYYSTIYWTFIFFVLSLILFYHSLKPHLFCHSILPFVQFVLFCLHPILPLIKPSFECEVVSLKIDTILPFTQTSSFLSEF